MSERKIWFITRPERDPKFHAEAMKALKVATDDFKKKWNGNRDVQKNYEIELAKIGLKRNNVSDSGSGGRTWCAMLRTFAYCYIDDEGYVKPTKTGEALIQGIKEFKNVTKQILTLQIPNAYFLEKGFRPKYEDGFAIRPARFLIRLVNQQKLDFHLTKEEITYFALTAKTDNDIEGITEKILEFRRSNEEKQLQIMQDIAAEYDHRDRNDHAARDYFRAHSDVAHTFMMICDYTGLVEYVRRKYLRIDPAKSQEVEEIIVSYDQRYPFNNRYKFSLERMAQNNGLDVDSYKANIYGSIEPASNFRKNQNKITEIIDSVPDLDSLSIEEVQNLFSGKFKPSEAEQIANELKNNPQYKGLIMKFVETYLGDMSPLDFEKETVKVLKSIGFEVIYKPKVNGTDTEIEILVKYGQNKCGIIDTKYYNPNFPLSSSLANYMGTEYIPNYENYEGYQLEFFGYITSGKFSGLGNLEKVSQKAEKHIGRDIKGAIITREVLLGFLDYCIENDLPISQRVDIFVNAMKNRGYDSLYAFLKNVQKESE